MTEKPEKPVRKHPDEEDTNTGSSRAFGQMPATEKPAEKHQTTASSDMEDRIVARLTEAFGRGQQQPGQPMQADAPPAPAFDSLSEEDQRLVTTLASVHPAGREVVISKREKIGTNLFFVQYTYAPSTGASRVVSALVYDDGEITQVFGGQ